MASIHTNVSAMTALNALENTNQKLVETQNRISSGLRVATASDNSAYWSIATTMRSDNDALSTVVDALGLGGATVDVTYAALETTVDVVSELKAKLVAARQPGVDRSKIQAEVAELQNQLEGITSSASFSGENWLFTPTGVTAEATKSIVSSFTRNDTGVSVQTITVDVAALKLYDVDNADGILDQDRTGAGSGATFKISTMDVSTLTDSTADLTILDDYISGIDTALQSITSSTASLGSVATRIEMQQDFVSALMDSIQKGISQLVDADMNEESTRLQALQVQQQLGVQSLSIANQSAQSILSLFQ
ncbi:MAG: flagellin [Hyphomicrobiaceae bacterium]